MNRIQIGLASLAIGGLAAGGVFLPTAPARAHCDTMAGPVIQDARVALSRGDVTPVLKWVSAGSETEIRDAFAAAVAVRKQGGQAAELADRYFFETLVRVHRAGEGAPYTGIRDEPVDPVIAMAEGALAARSADDMIQKLKAHMESVVREQFAAVNGAARERDASIEAGRTYVAAYVTYMHYVEALHAAIVATGVHAH